MKVQVKESDLISLIENIIKEQTDTTVCVTASPASGKGKGKWLGVGKMTDRDSLGNVKVGSEVTVDDGIPTKISKIWHDAEKRPSAFQFEDKNISMGGEVDENFWKTYQGGNFNRKDFRLNKDGVIEKNIKGKWTTLYKHSEVSKDSGLDNIYKALKAEGGKGRKLCFGVAGSKTSGFVNKTANYKAVTHTLEDIKTGKATLGIGDKGEVVKEIQKLVGAKPDGYFGPNTLAKVREYQKSKNFTVTGKIDKETLGVEGPTWGGKGGSAKNPIQGVWSVKDPNIKKGMHFQNTETKQIYKFDGKKYVELTDALAENHKKSLNDIILEVLDEASPGENELIEELVHMLETWQKYEAVGGQRTSQGHINDLERLLRQYTGQNEDEEMSFSLYEQEDGGIEGGGVETGTSDAGGTGAKTWESGVSRGAANPAGGVTHWADTYSINRGKANPLKESKWYNTVGDIVGIVDPTGVVDGINAMSYFKQGDIFYGMLSLISLVPYAGDLVAKPIVAAMKLGKFGGKGINAAVKSGSASKVAGAMGKTKMGKKFMGTFKDKKTQGFLASLFAKIGKIPGFGRLAKDGKTYTKLFTKAANISKTGAPVKLFRKSGGLLTKMQRRGLLGRTKLYSKFAAWMLGLGATQQVITNMPEDEMNDKFKEWASSEEGQEEIMSMSEEEKTDFIAVLQEMVGTES